MKKTLIALAALASTAAFAQSTVTLSGVVDTGIQKTSSAAAVQMAASRNGTSNWTLAGSEDLGGGLKANFKISTAFNSDDGTSNNGVLGNNDMWVGLSGGFGDVKLGRSTNPVFSHALTANGTKGVTGYATMGTALDTLNVYVPNQILYTSPTMSGFTVTASYAPSEVVGAKSHTAVALRYASGPINVTLASGNEHVAAAPAAPAAQLTNGAFKAKNVTQIAGAYDFGVARVLFTWQDDGNNAANADTAYALGVTAPVGPGTLWASYDVKELAATDGKVMQIGYKYPLSKRTLVYAQLGRKNAAMAAAASGTTGYGFGLQHSF
jgi:predicted porin